MRWFNNQYNGFPSTKFRGYLDHLTVYAVGQEVNTASTAPHSRRGAPHLRRGATTISIAAGYVAVRPLTLLFYVAQRQLFNHWGKVGFEPTTSERTRRLT